MLRRKNPECAADRCPLQLVVADFTGCAAGTRSTGFERFSKFQQGVHVVRLFSNVLKEV